MSNNEHFGRAIAYYLVKHGISQAEMSRTIGIAQGAINRIINNGARPEPETQKAICTFWPDPETNIRITCERLRDELALCGHQPDTVEIAPRGVSHDRVRKVVSRLAEIATDEPDLYAILKDLLEYVEYSRKKKAATVEESDSRILRVAETVSPENSYRVDKVKKTNGK